MMNTPHPNVWIDIAVEKGNWAEALPDYQDIIERAINATVGLAAEYEDEDGVEWEISVLLTDDDAVQVLNRDWRGKDKPTNVLSFPANADDLPPNITEGAPVMLGDIIMAFETVIGEAKEMDKSPSDHFCHLVVHGMLHLLGFDHVSDLQADEMEPLEVEILAGLGVASPYPDRA